MEQYNPDTLTDLMVVSAIEGIAWDAAAVRGRKKHIGPKAQEIMKDVETKIYGRSG